MKGSDKLKYMKVKGPVCKIEVKGIYWAEIEYKIILVMFSLVCDNLICTTGCFLYLRMASLYLNTLNIV